MTAFTVNTSAPGLPRSRKAVDADPFSFHIQSKSRGLLNQMHRRLHVAANCVGFPRVTMPRSDIRMKIGLIFRIRE